MQTLGQGKLEVLFIDYGSYTTVNAENLRKLPASLLQYEPSAKRCTLAYMKVPRKEKFQGPEADKYLRRYGLNKVHDAIVVEETNNLLSVILVEEGEPDWSTSINAFMISEGLGSLDQDALADESCPEEVIEWQSYSDEAREKLIGLWANDGNAAVSDDE
jgi:endonuclease YncB( thermonuclease family)